MKELDAFDGNPELYEWVLAFIVYAAIGWFSVFLTKKRDDNFFCLMWIYWVAGLMIGVPIFAHVYGWIISFLGAATSLVFLIIFLHKTASSLGDKRRDKQRKELEEHKKTMQDLKRELGEETFNELFK